MAKQAKKTVTGRVLHDPVKDKLRPMFPLDLSKCRTIDELVRAMGDTAFTGRQIGDAADVLETMARDKDCFAVMTLSGALTVAKMGLVFCDLIESGVVKAIVSTGALMAHGLVEATGLSHFRYNDKMDDRELFHAGYNRVYDSLEPETNLDHVEEVMDHIFGEWDAEEVACSWKIHRKIGEYLHKTMPGGEFSSRLTNTMFRCSCLRLPTPSWASTSPFIRSRGNKRSAHCCALTRSKISRNSPIPCWQPNAWAFSRLAEACRAIGPSSLAYTRSFSARRGYKKVPLKRYNYGVRICPEPVHWGGLSGSTYTEAVSWGKFVPPEEGGRFAEVFDDATVALPLIVGAVLQRIGYFKAGK